MRNKRSNFPPTISSVQTTPKKSVFTKINDSIQNFRTISRKSKLSPYQPPNRPFVHTPFLHYDIENSVFFELGTYLILIIVLFGQIFNLYNTPYTRQHILQATLQQHKTENNSAWDFLQYDTLQLYLGIDIPKPKLGFLWSLVIILLIPSLEIVYQFVCMILPTENPWEILERFFFLDKLIWIGVTLATLLLAGSCSVLRQMINLYNFRKNEVNSTEDTIIRLLQFGPVVIGFIILHLLQKLKLSEMYDNLQSCGRKKTHPDYISNKLGTSFHCSSWFINNVQTELNFSELQKSEDIRQQSKRIYGQIKRDVIEILVKSCTLIYITNILPVLDSDFYRQRYMSGFDSTWAAVYSCLVYVSFVICQFVHFFPVRRIQDIIAVATAMGCWKEVGIKVSDKEYIRHYDSERVEFADSIPKWSPKGKYVLDSIVWYPNKKTDSIFKAVGFSHFHPAKPGCERDYLLYSFFSAGPGRTIFCVLILQSILLILKITFYLNNTRSHRMFTAFVLQLFSYYGMFKLLQLWQFFRKIYRYPEAFHKNLVGTTDDGTSKKTE